jgi:hypothetical protein
MRCFDCPRNRSIVCTREPAYHTSIVSAPMRASTCSPRSRAGTEYVFFFTWIVLPWPTRTRTRSCVSSRHAGNGRNFDCSVVIFAPRAAFRRVTNARRNFSYSSRLAKSRLPRNSNSCSSASLKRR